MFQFEPLVDSTDFGTVHRYLRSSDSPDTRVLFVRDERMLSTVAGLITDEHPTDAQRSQFADWIREGHLTVGVEHASFSGEPAHDGRVDVDSISDAARCRVILLPPYYLVLLRTPLSSTVSNGSSTASRD